MTNENQISQSENNTSGELVAASKPVDLAKLSKSASTSVWQFDPAKAGEIAQQMFDSIERGQTRIAEQTIITGCFLADCRAALGHGNFLSWLEQNTARSRATAYRAIALAEHFSRSAKLLPSELAGITQIALALDVQPDAQSVIAKISNFVGDQTLADLNRRYRITAPRGGNTYERDGKKGRRLSPQEQQDAQHEDDAIVWRGRIRDLEGIIERRIDKDGWKALTREEQENLMGLYLDLSQRIRAHIATLN